MERKNCQFKARNTTNNHNFMLRYSTHSQAYTKLYICKWDPQKHHSHPHFQSWHCFTGHRQTLIATWKHVDGNKASDSSLWSDLKWASLGEKDGVILIRLIRMSVTKHALCTMVNRRDNQWGTPKMSLLLNESMLYHSSLPFSCCKGPRIYAFDSSNSFRLTPSTYNMTKEAAKCFTYTKDREIYLNLKMDRG